MELEDLQSTWQKLDRYLEQQNAIGTALLRYNKLQTTRRELRSVYLNQTLQMVFGIGLLFFMALFWIGKPHALSLLISGILVHAYAVGCIVTAAITLGLTRGIDFTGPILQIQQHLARLRRAYALSGIVAGHSWWFIWIPLLIVFIGLFRVDLYARAASVVWFGLAIGLAGSLLTATLYFFTSRSSNPHLRNLAATFLFGTALQRAQAQLDEIQRFEHEVV
jgi:hypothetical protein